MSQSDTARVVSVEWSRALGLPVPSSAGDDFFEAGGNSLLAVGLLEQLEERLGTAPSVETFFMAPFLRTIEEFYGLTPTDAGGGPDE
jgi:hypothetical protein